MNIFHYDDRCSIVLVSTSDYLTSPLIARFFRIHEGMFYVQIAYNFVSNYSIANRIHSSNSIAPQRIKFLHPTQRTHSESQTSQRPPQCSRYPSNAGLQVPQESRVISNVVSFLFTFLARFAGRGLLDSPPCTRKHRGCGGLHI